MSKTKIVETLLDNLLRILLQNLPALDELNYKKRTLYCGIAQNSSCRIAQNLSFAKTEKGNFARKLMRKERNILRFVPQKFCEWKP